VPNEQEIKGDIGTPDIRSQETENVPQTTEGVLKDSAGATEQHPTRTTLL